MAEPARRRGRRTQLARLRATRVKVAVAICAAVVFVAAMIFARLSYAGHSKKQGHSKALTPPPRFLQIVRKNRLDSGIVAPPQAAPEVATATS